MVRKLLSGLTYANVMATVAVFLALGGAATIAATSICPGDIPCVNSDDIIDAEVKNADIRKYAVGTGKIADNAITPDKFGTIPAAHVRKSANQSIPTGPPATPLSFDLESFDYGPMHDNVTNNSRLTAPRPGIYQMSAGVTWLNASGARVLNLEVNGEQVAQSAQDDPAASGYTTAQTVSVLRKLAGGDYVEATALQASGAPLAVNGGSPYKTFLAMHWVGPAP